MKVILNSTQLATTMDTLAGQIIKSVSGEFCVIGVRSRGEILAQRLVEKLDEMTGEEIPCGVLDITLYRDDLNSPQSDRQPLVRTTEIGFDIDDKVIILVDDILHTGRSTRAALDALIDLGRPRAIKLAVLVERPEREFPIQADFVGVRVTPEAGKNVEVNVVEIDGKDRVVIC